MKKLEMMKIRLKMLRTKSFNKIVLLHLKRVHREIMAPTPNFERAKKIYDSETIFTLEKIEDVKGKRIITVNTTEHGRLVFDVKEYLEVANDKEFIEREIALTTEKNKEKVTSELKSRPALYLIKS